jgi:hypothetical protein
MERQVHGTQRSAMSGRDQEVDILRCAMGLLLDNGGDVHLQRAGSDMYLTAAAKGPKG